MATIEKGTSLYKDAFYRLIRNKLSVIGVVLILTMAITVVIGPFFSSYNYSDQNLELGATAPSLTHLMGTDDLGRDLFVRILYGGRISLMVGILATLVSLCIGVSYGAIAGFAGGKVDALMMRFVDILYALPFMFFVILLMVVFGRNIYFLFIALGFISWLTMSRIVRGQVISIKEKEFILSARSIGVSNLGIITRHLIPNTLGPVIVYCTLTIPSVMLEEAFLSFLGLGVQPPMCSWGLLIKDGVDAMELYPWLVAFPGVILALALLALNFIGDGLRDALDPYSRKD